MFSGRDAGRMAAGRSSSGGRSVAGFSASGLALGSFLSVSRMVSWCINGGSSGDGSSGVVTAADDSETGGSAGASGFSAGAFFCAAG